MEIDPFDERELYSRQQHRNDVVSTTISTIVVNGGPLQLVIALLRVRNHIYVAFIVAPSSISHFDRRVSFNI